MDFDITFISAEPESAWLADIVYEIVYKWPVEMFGGKKPWDIIITRQPFIHEFVVLEANEMLYALRKEKSVPNQPIFPKDSLETSENLKQYLDKAPLRIMLIGDEQPNFYEIGDSLAQKFRTSHVTPDKLVSREIKRNTHLGKWLNWNLNNERGIPIFVVFKLLEAELRRDKYEERGFILTGFPIIPDLSTTCEVPCEFRNDEDYDIQPFDYYEKLDEILNEEAETATLFSVSSVCSSIEADGTKKEEEDYFKAIRNQIFVFPDGEEEEILKNCVRKQLSIIRHLWCQPEYIICINSNTFSDQYTIIKDVVQRAVLFYEDQNVLRFDGRLGTKALVDTICLRFYYINYKVNYDPIRVNTSDMPQLSLDNLCETGTILPNRKWWVSNFGRICPVTLFHGRRRFCDSKFPVQYLRYIFLCYSEKLRTTFVAHPKKYMTLIPSCRTAIIGPHRTGKTTLSKYLAQYFKADIYTRHIDESKAKITAENKSSMEKEFKGFETLKTKNSVATKRAKTEEWNSCVYPVLNDVLNEFLAVERNADIFSMRNAENYFEEYYKYSTSDMAIKQLILENAIFNESVKSISPFEFIEWVSIKPQSHHLYRQYVIDSAPLDINFWEELLVSDALPDCVYFLKTSLVKLTDIYSLNHDETCINHKMIYEKMCDTFTEWEELFAQICQTNRVNRLRMDDSTKEYIKYLIASRSKDATSFIKKYEELKLFLQGHDVICIEIDISKQTWSKSILKALFEHMSQFQTQPKVLYTNRSQSEGFEEDINEEIGPSPSSSFYNDLTDRDRMNGSDVSISKSVNFGQFREFCPVLLCDHNVLLKGNMHFAVEHKNKVYAMHSEQAMTNFLSNPIKYCQQKPVVPPARIFIIGLTHRNKIKMAETLANSFNVEMVSYAWYNSLFGDDFSVKSARDTYLENKDEFLEDLKNKYKNGAVTFGYPLLLEQFEDAIAQNLYPECIFIFNDTEEILHTMTRYFERLTSMQYYATRHSIADQPMDTRLSILADLRPLPQDLKHAVHEKCKVTLQPFLQEVHKIEYACMKLRIPVMKVPTNYKRKGLVEYYVQQINQHRIRTSMFEDVQIISMRESEMLLESGYYRFSRFKRSCPVHVSRLITLNHFEGYRTQGNVYPCIYRDFIYFLCGKKNLGDFKANPLEYVGTCNPPQMQDPMRIAVIGPPKSGVTTLCRTMAKQLGFKIFTLTDCCDGPISEREIIDFLKINKSSTPNGIILDNIPLTPSLLLAAARNTVDISAVFIVVTSFKKVLENWYAQTQNLKHCPRLSLTKVYEKFCDSQMSITCIRKNIAASLLNIHYLDGNANSWTLWARVYQELLKTSRSIQGYRIKLLKDRIASLMNLNLFYDIVVFKRDTNHYYCQVCLHLGKLNAFKYYYANVGPKFYSPECQKLLNEPYGYLNNEIYKKFKFSRPFEVAEIVEPLSTLEKHFMCIFQYKDSIYWCCDVHTINFMTYTQSYYMDMEKLKPLYVPFLVIGYTKKFVAFQGFCPVEYNLGRRVKGAMNLSVYYRKKVYLLANKENTIEFLSYPEKYRAITFDPFLYLDDQNVTFHGLHQDTISNVLLDLSYARPKHFGLNGMQSAATFVGLKLKSITASDKYSEYWNTAYRNFVKDAKTLAIELKKYQDNFNPYISCE